MAGCSQIAPQWILEVDTENGKIYKGEAEFTGEVIYLSRYANEPEEPHFHVSDESMKNLPQGISARDYRIELNSPDIKDPDMNGFDMDSLGADKKITIIASELRIFSEGTPSLNIKKILE